jgi:hypothetical protein
MTLAVPEIEPLVATTVLENVPATEPAVKRPVLVMVPPPAATVQAGTIESTTPWASLPTAVNCWVASIARVTSGVTLMLARAPGPGGVTSGAEGVSPTQAADNMPAKATATESRRGRLGGPSARGIRGFTGFRIALLQTGIGDRTRARRSARAPPIGAIREVRDSCKSV